MEKNQTTSLKYKIVSKSGKLFIRFFEAVIQLSITRKSVYASGEFSWIKYIEENYEKILAEYLSLKGINKLSDIHTISHEQHSVVEKEKWMFFPFYAYGIPFEENLKLCPETAKALESVPNFTTVFFSILKPGTYIKPHRGAFMGYLRYHLGVVIPEDYKLCGIKVEDVTYHWQAGKSLVFDDTFVHDAWNNSTTERVVLYIDIIRPMPKPLMVFTKILTKLISKSLFIQNAIRNYEMEGQK